MPQTATSSGAPAALLFDMDGLLLDTERVAQNAFLTVVGKHGVAQAPAQAFFLTLIGTSHAVSRDRIAGFLPDLDMDAFDRDWTREFRAAVAGGVPVKPGVQAALKHLAHAGHLMAVVTSSRRAHALENLASAGILEHFAQITGGDEVPAQKPDPAPYLQAAAGLGVDPRACVAFEDSDHGLTAAVAAGCRAVQIPDLRPANVALPALGQHVAKDLITALADLGLMDHSGAA